MVTGGAQGIGFAVARRLVASGAKVAIWDVDGPLAERTAAELGDGARSFAVDVLDFTAVQAAARGTLGAFGRIDALVTSARLAGMNATVIDDPVEEWRWLLDVNLNRTFHC